MSPETHDVSSMSDNASTTTCGRVKWFNNRAGYGFITVSSGEHKGEDVFVHHSAVQVDKEQYRYLVQGEYVDFKLCEVKDENHKWQAGEVSGVGGGQLMCETRLETRAIRNSTPRENTGDTPRAKYNNRDSEHTHYRVRSRGAGPRETDEWMLVRRRPSSSSRTKSTTTESPQPREVMKSRNNSDRGSYRVLDSAGDN